MSGNATAGHTSDRIMEQAPARVIVAGATAKMNHIAESGRGELPLVSVIMPAFNAARYISEAMASVQAQTIAGWELLVVDDGSTDGTVAMVMNAAVADPRIRLLATGGRGRGPAMARNLGLRASRGRYIAFLDSDDTWFPEKLAVQLRALANAAFCFSAYGLVQGQTPTGRVRPVPPSTSYQAMLKGSVIGCLTVVYDSAVFGKPEFPGAGDVKLAWPWNRWPGQIGHEDYALWLRMLRQAAQSSLPVVGIQQPLAAYRLHAASFSASKAKAAAFQWLVYRYHERLGWLTSAYYFAHYIVRAMTRRALA